MGWPKMWNGKGFGWIQCYPDQSLGLFPWHAGFYPSTTEVVILSAPAYRQVDSVGTARLPVGRWPQAGNIASKFC